jgi:DNA uptake protein ComE-like DNA-binding protein
MRGRNVVALVRGPRCLFRCSAAPANRRWTLLGAAMFFLASTVCAGTISAGPGSGQSSGSSSQTAAKQRTPAPAVQVDINHASVTELMKVPGMTETWAARIVRFRPYRTKQDLLDKGVVTGQVYDRIKDSVIAHKEKQ